MLAWRDLLGRMTGLCLLSSRLGWRLGVVLLVQSSLAREGEVGEVLEPLECPESRLTLSVSWQLSGSAVLGLLTLRAPGPPQSRDRERVGWKGLG